MKKKWEVDAKNRRIKMEEEERSVEANARLSRGTDKFLAEGFPE